MNKELFEKIKSAMKNIDNNIKNNDFSENDTFNLSDNEKLKFKELFNSGKKITKESNIQAEKLRLLENEKNNKENKFKLNVQGKLKNCEREI